MSEIKHTPCIYDIRKNGIKYINTQNKSAGAGGKYVLNQDSRVGSFVQNKNHFNVIIPVWTPKGSIQCLWRLLGCGDQEPGAALQRPLPLRPVCPGAELQTYETCQGLRKASQTRPMAGVSQVLHQHPGTSPQPQRLSVQGGSVPQAAQDQGWIDLFWGSLKKSYT